jgi:hypothetical protein
VIDVRDFVAFVAKWLACTYTYYVQGIALQMSGKQHTEKVNL